ncbi:MAG: 2-hydroxychromene-2-carboxylate isomerase [Candidatus Marinimicrobia bacterium]|jgi:2-hydroxychromene-2-carboxylate isomerase|nr:2-hydroxychromene-2-carboxylate isomerase [Candidatus Neomarinimicrobiota bacterium]MBT6637323.1 2-hydroxychromene-2-carboxylate isomerase [Candidatus Neomarinimicrobiota bacterium]
MKEIEFWFSIGSTYTYLSVTRLKDVEEKFEVKFSWQPFSVRKIMIEMDNVPFPPTKKVKADYMWRDIERRANSYGFSAKVPAPYPLKEFDLANFVAVLGMQEGWCAEYITATYRRWFVDGLEPGSEPNVSASLREIGQQSERVLELATSENIAQAYLKQTEQAQSKNIFGSPSFIVDGELFWGDDRLEDAVNWALK